MLGSPRIPSRWAINWDCQDSEVLIVMLTVYYSKSIQGEISKGKSLQVWQHIWSVTNQRISPGPWCPGFYGESVMQESSTCVADLSYPCFMLPEKGQVFFINYIVSIDHLSITCPTWKHCNRTGCSWKCSEFLHPGLPCSLLHTIKSSFHVHARSTIIYTGLLFLVSFFTS